MSSSSNWVSDDTCIGGTPDIEPSVIHSFVSRSKYVVMCEVLVGALAGHNELLLNSLTPTRCCGTPLSRFTSPFGGSFDSVDGADEQIVERYQLEHVKSGWYLCNEDGKLLCRTLKNGDERFVWTVTTHIGDNVSTTTFQTTSNDYVCIANDRFAELTVERFLSPVTNTTADRRCFQQMTGEDNSSHYFRSAVHGGYLTCDDDGMVVLREYKGQAQTEGAIQFLLRDPD